VTPAQQPSHGDGRAVAAPTEPAGMLPRGEDTGVRGHPNGFLTVIPNPPVRFANRAVQVLDSARINSGGWPILKAMLVDNYENRPSGIAPVIVPRIGRGRRFSIGAVQTPYAADSDAIGVLTIASYCAEPCNCSYSAPTRRAGELGHPS
jgi:hypothetical protein